MQYIEFKVRIPFIPGVSVSQHAHYVRDALRNWGGQAEPGDFWFSIVERWKLITVRRFSLPVDSGIGSR